MKDTHVLSREIVFERIARRPGMNNADISAELGWTINRVTPRVRELLDLGRITIIAYKRSPFGKLTRCYAVRRPKE